MCLGSNRVTIKNRPPRTRSLTLKHVAVFFANINITVVNNFAVPFTKMQGLATVADFFFPTCNPCKGYEVSKQPCSRCSAADFFGQKHVTLIHKQLNAK